MLSHDGLSRRHFDNDFGRNCWSGARPCRRRRFYPRSSSSGLRCRGHVATCRYRHKCYCGLTERTRQRGEPCPRRKCEVALCGRLCVSRRVRGGCGLYGGQSARWAETPGPVRRADDHRGNHHAAQPQYGGESGGAIVDDNGTRAFTAAAGHRFCGRTVVGFLRNWRRFPDRARPHACDRDAPDDGDRHLSRCRRSIRGSNCSELCNLRNDRLADCQPVRSRRPGWRRRRCGVRKSARSKEAGTQSDVRWPGYISYLQERTVAW